MLDFTPVDEAAKALLLLAETPGNCDVYHLFNPQVLSMGELSAMLKFAGVIAEPVPQAFFEERISRLMQQSAMATKLTAALAWYKELPMPDITFRNHPDSQKTEALLSRCRYQWPVLTASYSSKNVNVFEQLLAWFGYYSIYFRIFAAISLKTTL